MKGWRLTSTAGGDTSHNPPTHARSDCAKAFSCCRLASRPSPRDSRRRQPTVAAAAHARLAQSYAVCSRLMPSRHAPTHSCDANMRLGPVTARRRRQAVTRRQTHPLRSRPRGMSVCHEKRHRVRACAWCLDAQRLRVFAADNRQTHAVEARREMPRPARPARPPLSKTSVLRKRREDELYLFLGMGVFKKGGLGGLGGLAGLPSTPFPRHQRVTTS